MLDLHERLEFATSLAHGAGDIMLRYFQIGLKRKLKSDNSPVTIADKEVNKMVIDAIAKAYPNEGVLSEEESSLKENGEYLWVCDPIDGTVSYACGIPTNVFSLALVQDGKPIVAVVYDPYIKRLFHAILGKGAFCNDQKIHVSSAASLQEVIVGLPGKNVSPFLDPLALRGKLQYVTYRKYQLGSTIYESMLVAAGQFGASLYISEFAHDIAAVQLIVEEAGGKVTDLYGNEQRYDRQITGAIISNGLIHDQLVTFVKPYLKI